MLQAYISKIVGYLLQLRSVEGGALKGTIEQTTSECVKLILCVCVVNPTVLIGATQGRVDEVLATKTKLDTVFQLTCLVSNRNGSLHRFVILLLLCRYMIVAIVQFNNFAKEIMHTVCCLNYVGI